MPGHIPDCAVTAYCLAKQKYFTEAVRVQVINRELDIAKIIVRHRHKLAYAPSPQAHAQKTETLVGKLRCQRHRHRIVGITTPARYEYESRCRIPCFVIVGQPEHGSSHRVIATRTRLRISPDVGQMKATHRLRPRKHLQYKADATIVARLC